MADANIASEATTLVDGAVVWLVAQLPPTWAVERLATKEAALPTAAGGELVRLMIRSNTGESNVAVAVRRRLQPRDVDGLVATQRLLREFAFNTPMLVVAPWLSRRTRQLLTDHDINYIDLTGNSHLVLESPALVIRTAGAERDLSAAPRPPAQVRGPKAIRLVRFLIDVTPPYTVTTLSKETGLNAGYISRLLDTLDSEALVERGRRGEVTDTDLPGLLDRAAQRYAVFDTNAAVTFLAPKGPRAVLDALPSWRGGRAAVSGSFAAVRWAPVAAPALLVVYCDQGAALVDNLGLLPAASGANVALLQPYDPVVWERTSVDDGVTYVAPSQAAIDCLTGNGRMPAEGQALATWMAANPASWRQSSATSATAQEATR